MTMDAQLDALRALGYTPREAQFLTTVALHSGYFVRRQFMARTGIGRGKTALAFTRKLVARRHATATAIGHNTHLYHVCGKPLYAALGEPDSRNRRARTPFAIRSRLLALDYVLAHPSRQFLATERDRVAFFTCELGVDPGRLPVKFYGDDRQTARHFVDGSPISIETSEGGDRTVVFAYVDDGVSSVVAFRTFLEQYRDLLAALPWPARMAYVAASGRQFHAAAVVFEQFVSDESARLPMAEAATVESVLEFFSLRQRYEQRAFAQLKKAGLDALREYRERFRGDRFDALYATWTRGGDAAVRAELTSDATSWRTRRLSFETWCGSHAYELFGTVWMAS